MNYCDTSRSRFLRNQRDFGSRIRDESRWEKRAEKSWMIELISPGTSQEEFSCSRRFGSRIAFIFLKFGWSLNKLYAV